MNLSAPTVPVFLISLVIAVIALLLVLNIIPSFGLASVWVALIAYVVLALGALLKGI